MLKSTVACARHGAMFALGLAAAQAYHYYRSRRNSQAVAPSDDITIEIEVVEERAVEAPAQGAAGTGSQTQAVPKPEEKVFGLRTLLEALQVSELVTTETIEGPFQLNPGEQAPLVCFQFKMSHFVCKVYLAAGAEEGTRHLKLQTIFEDNRNGLIEEDRYFMANEWNSSKPYTRLQCGSRDRGQTNVFTLEYDLLCPVQLPHHSGVHMLTSTLRMWYTSMMACVMHIVAPRDLPFATHNMIVENTLSVAVREEDGLTNEACPICLENFQVGDKVRRLPCMHLFHVVGGEASVQGRHCNIDRHLVLDKQCPVCKTPIDIMEKMEREGAQSGQGQPAASGTAPRESVAQSGERSAQEGTQAEVSRPSPAADPAREEAAERQQGQNAAGLPEQAAELERIVRSLQSRWLQIQDVVAGVQQMLHYIEDSQSALSATRENSSERTGEETAQETVQEPSEEAARQEEPSQREANVPVESPSAQVPVEAPVERSGDGAAPAVSAVRSPEEAPVEAMPVAQSPAPRPAPAQVAAAILAQARRGASPEAAAVQICRPVVQLDPRRLRRRGIFRFQELDVQHASAQQLGPEYREHQMLYRMKPHEEVQLAATDDFEPVGWFGKGEIPFDEMPEDDAVWYERVLFDDAMLRGDFSFRGTTLLKHNLEEVPREEGLCESMLAQPLLLHNPDCSKSRAMKEALESSGASFAERRYLEDPLTLSELEVLSARLKAADPKFSSRQLCRDVANAEVDDDDEILEAVALRPKDMQRPVLVTRKQAAFGRPTPEDALRLLQ